MEKDILLLQETDLFKNLTSGQIKTLLNICRKVKFPENEIIMREGDMGNSLYIILEGTVEVIKSLIISDVSEDDSREAVKNKVFTKIDEKSHAVFGEIALLEECKRTATIRANTNCIFYEIKKDDFLQLVETDCALGSKILLNLARIVSARLRKADEDTIKLTTVLSIVLRESAS
ncbi:MAG: cyclic nucleotide-binding domain-containing protein [Smithellaceae bacterium]